MKKILEIIFTILISHNLYAQVVSNEKTPFPASYIITTDTTTAIILLPDSCWQMIADPTGKMTLEQALKPESFKDTTRKDNYQSDVFWFRYRIANFMHKPANITLTLNGAPRTDLYIKVDNGKWNHYKTGREVPWSQRNGLRRLNFINMVIPAGKEITVFERDKKHSFLFDTKVKPGIGFGFTDTIVKNKYVKNDSNIDTTALWSFMLGMMVLAFVINSYFWTTVREKEFLYFGLFQLASTLNQLSLLTNVIFRDSPKFQQSLILLSSYPYFFFAVFFIRHFLKTFLHFPRWDRWLVIIAFAQLATTFFVFHASYLLHRYLPFSPGAMLMASILITSISLLITFLLCMRSQDRSVRIMVIATSPSILFWTMVSGVSVTDTVMQSVWGKNIHNDFLLFFINKLDLIMNLTYLWIILISSLVLFMRFSELRKKVAMQEVEKEKERNALIAQQKIELEKQVIERTSELKQSLDNLKSTQKQLIQSEKMASLGELTAGIAHEIQNPLNFVNNFSDINKELLEELKGEADNGNIEEVKTIATDVIANEEKINHHGKRAEAIVKGMLQHSRTSTGKKEPTDINALCDEYLRLSYHGMRAKDKSFNCEMKTDFDESIGKINVVPQDIGRVLLNLINNAFYACAERSRSTLNEKLSANSYQPIAEIKTRKVNDTIEIRVIDNGNGIPEKIKDKIFQPFFTTKPTGQGTGLGLSLSYDIVKAHGGEIKVEKKEGEDTNFIIHLPLRKNV